jgi:hypothetical protein
MKAAKFRGQSLPRIIFKGKGTGITAAERAKNHKDVCPLQQVRVGG